MKKMVSLMLSAALVFSLAACGTQGSQNSSSNGSGVTESSVDSSESGTDTSEEISEEAATEETAVSEPADDYEDSNVPETAAELEEAAEENGGTLIAYFSWSGNTERMAQIIQEETGADLFEIQPAAPYTDDYDTLLDVARQEQADNARPQVASSVENWDSYDTVFVGYPDWWGDAPMLIYSFLESYDWEGKTLVPFCTSGGSGFGRSLEKLPDSAPGAEILEGLHVSGSSVGSAEAEVADWISSLDIE